MALTQLTKIDGGGISTTSDYRVGVITATKFVGPIEGVVTGSLTGTATTAVNAQGLIGTPNITVGILTASSANFSGNVSIGGTLTYEDVTNIDSVGIITARGGIDCNGDIDVDGHTNLDNVSIAGVTTTTENINIDADNKKLQIGDGQDLKLYHNSGNSFIENSTGYLLLNTTSDLVLRANADVYLQPASGENAIKATGHGSVDLYYDQNNHTTPKLATSATGVTIDGTAVAGGLDISGDIDVDGHTNLDNVSIAGITTVNGGFIFDNGTNAGKDLQWQPSNNRLAFFNDVKATFGNTVDLQIYHNSTENHIYGSTNKPIIFSTNTDERLRISSTGNVGINQSDPYADLDITSSVEDADNGTLAAHGIRLAHVGATDEEVIPITAAFRTQQDRARAGIGFISKQASGTDGLAGAIGFYTRNTADGNGLYRTDERVRIAQDGNVGIGTDNPSQLLSLSSTSPRILLTHATSPASNCFIDYAASGVLELSVDDNNVSANSKLQIRMDGATAKLTIDDAGRVIIGSTAVGRAGANSLTISGSDDTGMTIRSGTSHEGNIYFSDGSSGGNEESRGIFRFDHSNDSFQFYTSSGNNFSQERLRIVSSGGTKLTRTTVGGQESIGNVNNTWWKIGTWAGSGVDAAARATITVLGANTHNSGNPAGGETKIYLSITGTDVYASFYSHTDHQQGVCAVATKYDSSASSCEIWVKYSAGYSSNCCFADVTNGFFTGASVNTNSSSTPSGATLATSKFVVRTSNNTTSSEALHIDSSGRLMVGNTAASSFNTSINQFVLGNGVGNNGMVIYTGASHSGSLIFNDVADGTFQGGLVYKHGSGTDENELRIFANAGSRVQAGATYLQVDDGTNARLRITPDGTSTNMIVSTTTGNGSYCNLSYQAANHIFRYGGNERGRLSTEGNFTITGEYASAQDYPDIRPSLDLNFQATKKLDPRISYRRLGPASYHDETGKVVLVGADAPRFDHTFPTYWDEGSLGDSNSRGISKGLLIERSRTNIYKNNHNLTTANDHGGITQTVNTTETTAPDGTFTATKVTASGGDQWMRFDGNNGLDTGSINHSDTFSTSVYMKTVGTSNVTVALDFGDAGNKSFSVGQEWKRYAISNVHNNYGATTKFIDFILQGNIYIWGLQCENGANPSSYIPTRGTLVTRGDEYVAIDGQEFTDFYNPVESSLLMVGTMHQTLAAQGQLNIAHIGDTNANGHGIFREHGTRDVWYHIRNGDSTPSGGNINPNGFGDWDENEEARIAIAFKNGDQAISVNGGNQVTATVTSNYPTANITKMWIGSAGNGSFFNGTISRIAYYPKQLTDSQLNTLTA